MRRSLGELYKSKDTSVPSDDDDVMHSTPKQSRLTPLAVDLSSVIITTSSQKDDNIQATQNRQNNNSPVVISTPVGFFHFSKILSNCGYSLSKTRNSAYANVAEFRSTLTKWYEESMKGNPDDRTQADKFVDEMQQYLNTKECLLVGMSPTMHREELYQPSLLQSLLGVVPLQEKILKIIKPMVAEIAYTATDEEDTTFLNSLMTQLRWIPNLVNEEQLVVEILEILERARDKAKREMIRLIPDIFSSVYHEKIAETLKKLLDDFSALSSTIVETLAVLDVSDSTLEKVRFDCIENMSMVEPKDLGAFFAFLFTVQDSDILNEIISSLREKVKIEISGNDAVVTTQEFLQKLRFCINVNSKIVPEWLMIIKKEFKTDVTSCTSLDLIMFLLFLEQSCNKKVVEGTLKTLFEHEEFVLNLLDDIIQSTPLIIDLVFEPISKFLEKILQKDVKFYSVVKNILVKLFLNCNDYNGQSVVVIFTSGLASLAHGNQKCRETCISGLHMIGTQNIFKLLKFIPLIMGVMEFVIKFSPSDIRVIMRILAHAANVPDSRESARFESEFSILLTKQLTNVDDHIRCIGVIGSVATIAQLIQIKAESTKIMNLMEKTWRYVEKHSSACFVFFDELSGLLEEIKIDPLIVEKFKETLCEKFMENWVLNSENMQNNKSLSTTSSGLKLSPVKPANQEIDDDLVIRFESDPLGMHSCCMIAHTRLLCLLESQLNDGDLSGIDVILGCPLLLPQFKLYESKAEKCTVAQRTELARLMILGINFIRETMGAFFGQQENKMIIKIWYRLTNLVELQQKLADFVLKFAPELNSLPCAYTSDFLEKMENTSVIPTNKKKKKIASKNSNEENVDDDDEVPSTSKSVPKKKSKKKPAQNVKKPTPINDRDYKDFGVEIQPPNLVPYFRKIPKNVFQMLNFPLNVKHKDVDYAGLLTTVDDSTQAAEIMKKIKVLYPQTLVLLLRDLNIQVESLRICIIKDIFLDFPSDFFDCLLGHLDVLFEACKKGKDRYEAKHKLEASFLYVYKTMNNYLNGIKAPAYKELFKKVLKTLTKHVEESELPKKEQMALYINGNPKNISSPLAAMEHLKFMKYMYDNGDVELKSFLGSNIETSIDEYLKRPWKLSASMIQSMLKMWFAISDDPLDIILKLTESIIPNEEDEEEVFPRNDDYKSCTKLNFPTWYRVLFENLAQFVSKTMQKLELDEDEKLKNWTMALKIFRILVIEVIKKNKKPIIIMPLLKNSKIFLEASGQLLTLLLTLWKKKEGKQAKELMTNLQTPARKIQSICGHCKVEKFSQILRYIPPIKKALEALLFRVRQQFTANDIPLHLFTIANLKHKSIEGREINSQIEAESQTQDENDDEEIDDEEVSYEDVEEDGANGEDVFSDGEDSDLS